MCLWDPASARWAQRRTELGARARQACAIAFARTFHAPKSRDRRGRRIGAQHTLNWCTRWLDALVG
jgi:hypothetical protein